MCAAFVILNLNFTEAFGEREKGGVGGGGGGGGWRGVYQFRPYEKASVGVSTVKQRHNENGFVPAVVTVT